MPRQPSTRAPPASGERVRLIIPTTIPKFTAVDRNVLVSGTKCSRLSANSSSSRFLFSLALFSFLSLFQSSSSQTHPRHYRSPSFLRPNRILLFPWTVLAFAEPRRRIPIGKTRKSAPCEEFQRPSLATRRKAAVRQRDTRAERWQNL